MKTARIIGLMIGFSLASFAGVVQASFWLSTTPAPVRMALLLPLQGPQAESGQAIRDGFLAAYYQSLPQDSSAPTLRIVDTSGADIVMLYRQAIAQGAKVVVGPLSKTEGMALVQAGSLAVPTVLLNTLPETATVANLYQLGLSPTDEAKQVAAKAWKEGKKSALIIVPDSAWGQRVAQVFLNEWQTLGGRIVGEMHYDGSEQLSGQVSQLLSVDQSEKRAKALRGVLQEKIRTLPYRRQDMDMVLLIAKPEFARRLRPLLSFYYAGEIPVYGTSHLYSGSPNRSLDQDLNGVIFCAIPWEIAPQQLSPDLQATLRSIQKAWPQAAQKQPTLFALGVDSYRIARQLSTGTVAREINGATGQLILQANGVWYRQLPWAQMVQGRPQLLDRERW